MAVRALVLTSGGLDSILACKLLQQQGIDVIGIYFITWFNVPKFKKVEDIPQSFIKYGITIYTYDLSNQYTEILLNPRYGYGSSVNPCIDCKILFLRTAKILMKKYEAQFIATGEVVGQRPMTQNLRAMKLIETQSGLDGYLVRPLSAGLLPETIPEKRGWLRRERMLNLSGRTRRPQIELAQEFGITDYPSPAGGCILTEKNFASRLLDYIQYSEKITVDGLYTLRYGRHFRISDTSKLVVGKNREENMFLKRIPWGNLVIDCESIPGPYSLFQWNGKVSDFKLALDICFHYSNQEAKRAKEISFCRVLNGLKEKRFYFRWNFPKVNPTKFLIQ